MAEIESISVLGAILKLSYVHGADYGDGRLVALLISAIFGFTFGTRFLAPNRHDGAHRTFTGFATNSLFLIHHNPL